MVGGRRRRVVGDKEERARSRKAAGRHTAFVGSAQYAPSAYADRRGARRPRLSSLVVQFSLHFFHSVFSSVTNISGNGVRVRDKAGRTGQSKARERKRERGFSSAAAAAAVAVLFSTGSRGACVFLVGANRHSGGRRSTRGFYTLAKTGRCTSPRLASGVLAGSTRPAR